MFDSHTSSIDTTRWPIVLITPHHEPRSDGELSALLGELDRVLQARNGRFALVIDTRQALPPSATQRAQIGDYCMRAADHSLARCVSVGVVATTDLMRATVTAVGWHSGRRGNVATFDDLTLALAAGQDCLDVQA
jgi:hypothetical protein